MDRSNAEQLISKYYDPWLVEGQEADIDKIGFFNYGYWKGGIDSLEVAQIELIETLVSFLSRPGSVLDVACGKGASSKFLTKYFAPANITGINISERQLQACRIVAPECEFRTMDATRLDFDESSFDNVLCIEAAFHFLTRQDFFQQAYRVLKPGGRIALSDVIVHDRDLLSAFLPEQTVATMPLENCLPRLDAYRESLLKVGFKYVRVEDSTDDSVLAITRFRAKRAESDFSRRKDYGPLINFMAQEQYWRKATTWCMAYAIK